MSQLCTLGRSETSALEVMFVGSAKIGLVCRNLDICDRVFCLPCSGFSPAAANAQNYRGKCSTSDWILSYLSDFDICFQLVCVRKIPIGL